MVKLSIGFSILVGLVAFGILCFAQPEAYAAEVVDTDIALVEDVDGSIHAAIATPDGFLSRAACAFYQRYPDRYDAIFVFTTVPQNFMTNVQYGWPVQQTETGIGRGDQPYDGSAAFCSNGRLLQAVKMGDINMLPNNPDDLYTGIPMYALTGIQLMAHEFGHHWLAAIEYDKGDGNGHHCMVRGYEPTSEEPEEGTCDGGKPGDFNQHWSYFFNSRSVMYGSFIEEIEPGKFRMWYENPKYSELDQYLMGLRSPSEVGPMFHIIPNDGDGLLGSASLPMMPGTEKIVEGVRKDFTIEDVIRAIGPRNPPTSECHWKGVFILLYTQQYPYNDIYVQKLVTYANRWQEFYSWATDGRGSFDVTIDGRGEGTATCPAPQSDGDYDWDEDTDLPNDGDIDDLDSAQEWESAESETCTTGSRRCDGDLLVECRDSSHWVIVERCGLNGQICQNGQCIDETDGDFEATDTSSEKESTEAEAAGCISGERRCMGSRVYVCNSGSWVFAEDCGDLSCQSGECVNGADEEVSGTGSEPKESDGSGCMAGAAADVFWLIALVWIWKRSRKR